MKCRNKKILLLAALFVTVIISILFVNDYLLCGDDVAFHLGRIEGLAEAVSMGDFLEA